VDAKLPGDRLLVDVTAIRKIADNITVVHGGRNHPASVKIIGISSGISLDDESDSSPVKYCQLWFDGDIVPKTTIAVYAIVQETHGRRSVASEWVVVVVTFFNNNFVNCKAISNYGYQNSRSKIQYKPKKCTYM